VRRRRMTEKVDAMTTKLSPNPGYQGWESLGIPYSLPEAVRRCLISSVSFRTFAQEAAQRWSAIHLDTQAPSGMAEGMESEMIKTFYQNYFAR
jgi:hypothetical protein